MNVVVHYPKDEHAVEHLREQVSVLHAEYIYSYLNKLDIPAEEKANIIQGIRDALI